MKQLFAQNFKFFLGLVIFLLGLVLFSALSNAVRFLGIALIVTSLLYLASQIYSKLNNNSNGENNKSRIRDQIFRYQHRR